VHNDSVDSNTVSLMLPACVSRAMVDWLLSTSHPTAKELETGRRQMLEELLTAFHIKPPSQTACLIPLSNCSNGKRHSNKAQRRLGSIASLAIHQMQISIVIWATGNNTTNPGVVVCIRCLHDSLAAESDLSHRCFGRS
jgi:hypothetical protein